MKALISIDELPYEPYRIERIKADLTQTGYDPSYYMVWTGTETWDQEDVVKDLYALEVRTGDHVIHRVSCSTWINTGTKENLDHFLTINSNWTEKQRYKIGVVLLQVKVAKKKAPKFL